MSDLSAEAIAEAVVARLSEQPSDRPLYSPKTLAKRLALSERTARQLIADGKIESFTVSDGSRRMTPEAVDHYIATRQAKERTA